MRINKPDGQGKTGTAASDAPKSVGRRKFNVPSSASYWLSQINLCESASKHSISLGFFKLALESGCESLQRVRGELKSYALRHNILELGEPARELLKSYNILEALEQFQMSQPCSDAPEKLIKTSGEEANAEAHEASESTKMHGAGKELPSTKNRASGSRVAHRTVKDGNVSAQRKLQKPSNLGSNKQKGKVKTTTKKPANEIAQPPTKETLHEDTENTDRKPVEEANWTAEGQTS